MGLGIEKDRNYGRIEAKSAQSVLKFSIQYESQFFLSKEDLNSSYSHFVQCILCKILSLGYQG